MAAVRGRRGTERAGARAAGARRRGLPLSLVVARYFAYVVVALGAVWFAAFAALSASINTGAVYPANYGSAHIDEEAAALQAAPRFSAQDVPTVYRYAVVDAQGAVVRSDLSDEALEAARSLAGRTPAEGDAQDAGVAVGADGGRTYAVFGLPDGTTCVLITEFLPQFADRRLAETLPNPQDLMLAVGCAGSVAAVALVACRAGRVLARKMAPLVDAADRIAREDLDFTVEGSNVRQVNDVLGAMERMRGSLKASLEARWRAEQAQRDQVAALAHDLKTPLTVVRANAEYAAEEACDMAARCDVAPEAKRALGELARAATDAAEGARRLDGHVRLLIEASHGAGSMQGAVRTSALSLAQAAAREAQAFARTARASLSLGFGEGLEAAFVRADEAAVGRAVMNVVSNALDHATAAVALSFRADARAGVRALSVVCEDDGPGFSAEALAHGTERFFRGAASRTGAASGEHYGIGLFAASEVAAAHGGGLELANRTNGSGRTEGARVVLWLPLCD